MRKVKLQMQVSLDGFVASESGGMDWMTWNWSQDLNDYVTALTESVDTILLGRVLAEGFIPHWTGLQQNPATADAASKIFVETPKIVFSKTLERSDWDNTTLSSDLAGDIAQLKSQPGNDIITYGGGNFVSNMIAQGLIDEYHLFVNPVAIGSGMAIFTSLQDPLKLKLVRAMPTDCGILVLCYVPADQ